MIAFTTQNTEPLAGIDTDHVRHVVLRHVRVAVVARGVRAATMQRQRVEDHDRAREPSTGIAPESSLICGIFSPVTGPRRRSKQAPLV
jgi:hypothetical protein